ncbi:MAG TPA: hypothetical protein VHA13_04385 [Gammaproteobacteria bacterium]|nr:hypothetical protein [Gammaproteobacteria bacterium]
MQLITKTLAQGESMESHRNTNIDGNDELSLRKKNFFQEIEHNPGPKFDCSGLYLNVEEIKKLVEVLKTKQNVECIDLGYNALDYQSMLYIRDLILNCPQLKEINLETNNIGDQGIEWLLNGNPDIQDSYQKIEQDVANQKLRKILPNLNINFDTNAIRDPGLLLIRNYLAPEPLLSLLGGNIVYISAKLYEECRIAATQALQNMTRLSNNKATFQYSDKKNKHEEYKTHTPPKSPTTKNK